MKLKVKHTYNPNFSTAPVIGSDVTLSLLTQVKETDYVGNKIYENGKLKRILVDGGYWEDGKYYFFRQDHLGNTRVVQDQDGTLIQRKYYYPFGAGFPENTKDNGKQPYKYNGKELDQMHRLDWYDYSARHYDSALGRFTTVDPLAEKFYNWSPYVYCYNNPIKHIDPDGKQGIVVPTPVGPAPVPVFVATGTTTSATGSMTLDQREALGREYKNAGKAIVETTIALLGLSIADQAVRADGLMTATESALELNRNAPDPKWERRKEKEATEWAAEQLAAHKALETGGHNPENRGRNFNPDPNKNHSTTVKIVAGITALVKLSSDIYNKSTEDGNTKKEMEKIENKVEMKINKR